MRTGLGLIASIGMLTAAQAAPDARQSAQDAAYLQEAFGHDLCTRGDRELRKLNKALGRKPMTPIVPAAHTR